MSTKALRLTRKQREELFGAEMVLFRVGLHLKEKFSTAVFGNERLRVSEAMAIVWRLYHLVLLEQRKP
jgi:hypothetical protein